MNGISSELSILSLIQSTQLEKNLLNYYTKTFICFIKLTTIANNYSELQSMMQIIIITVHNELNNVMQY